MQLLYLNSFSYKFEVHMIIHKIFFFKLIIRKTSTKTYTNLLTTFVIYSNFIQKKIYPKCSNGQLLNINIYFSETNGQHNHKRFQRMLKKIVCLWKCFVSRHDMATRTRTETGSFNIATLNKNPFRKSFSLGIIQISKPFFH